MSEHKRIPEHLLRLREKLIKRRELGCRREPRGDKSRNHTTQHIQWNNIVSDFAFVYSLCIVHTDRHAKRTYFNVLLNSIRFRLWCDRTRKREKKIYLSNWYRSGCVQWTNERMNETKINQKECAPQTEYQRIDFKTTNSHSHTHTPTTTIYFWSFLLPSFSTYCRWNATKHEKLIIIIMNSGENIWREKKSSASHAHAYTTGTHFWIKMEII